MSNLLFLLQFEEEEGYDDILFDACCLIILIVHYNSIRRRTKLTRSAILTPKLSPWATHLFKYGDENSFVSMTEFSHESFGSF